MRAPASRSLWSGAAGARTCVAILLALTAPAIADQPEDDMQVVDVPVACIELWNIPSGAESPVAWDAMLSFAACIQDASIYRVERTQSLSDFVQLLQARLAPALVYYMSAIEEGPGPIQLRAAYAVALGQVGLMTRARASLAAPELRDELEELLDPHAQLAYMLFTAIVRGASEDPELARDAVTRYVVRSSRQRAAELRTRWSVPRDLHDR